MCIRASPEYSIIFSVTDYFTPKHCVLVHVKRVFVLLTFEKLQVTLSLLMAMISDAVE
jgi:hypothetical protein